MSRKRGIVETGDYADFMRRGVKAYAKRVAGGQIEMLPALVDHLVEVDTAIDEAVKGLCSEPNNFSIADVGRALGITRQAAQKRWGHLGTRKVGGQPAVVR
jgi:hypothetical protein